MISSLSSGLPSTDLAIGANTSVWLSISDLVPPKACAAAATTT